MYFWKRRRQDFLHLNINMVFMIWEIWIGQWNIGILKCYQEISVMFIMRVSEILFLEKMPA